MFHKMHDSNDERPDRWSARLELVSLTSYSATAQAYPCVISAFSVPLVVYSSFALVFGDHRGVRQVSAGILYPRRSGRIGALSGLSCNPPLFPPLSRVILEA
ncbi:hypothetical protein FIBSPDRAFT_498232 [Athelia psychrophila]|uniref:Uncharacterized protein n=1 Tax=Athelia psychrophila TaxID=1759441 RepID=A0A166KGF6_9AGAM|nr:hypothetical protein FIBSPDRAFT_498232 [Fibularhizoctonia sp. CBS 109695]